MHACFRARDLVYIYLLECSPISPDFVSYESHLISLYLFECRSPLLEPRPTLPSKLPKPPQKLGQAKSSRLSLTTKSTLKVSSSMYFFEDVYFLSLITRLYKMIVVEMRMLRWISEHGMLGFEIRKST